MNGHKFRKVSVIALSLATVMMAATPVDARRGGSFGSRGSRTADAPPPTRTAPQQSAPVERTMTDTRATPAGQQGATAQRPGQAAAPNAAQRPNAAPARSGGMAKGLIGGLVAGGLIGMMMGNGFGALGGSGFLMALLQVALIGGLIWLALRLFRRRPAAPAMVPAGAAAGMGGGMQNPFQAAQSQPQSYTRPQPAPVASVAPVSVDLMITADDQQTFENLLHGVQDAFGREDYATLRTYTTPEIMSYLAEELSNNATRGLRNAVSNTQLLQADVAEAWREENADYATVAMRYESIDVMLDRNTGAVVEGDPVNPTQTTEIWTFVRDANKLWLLSAIQQA